MSRCRRAAIALGVIALFERHALAAHFQAVYLISIRRLDVSLSTGPSFFSV